MQSVQHILESLSITPSRKSGISIIQVTNSLEGISIAKQLLIAILSHESLLLLSGGRTPKELYSSLANERDLHVGAVTLIDERYGEPFHESSNERMLKDTGLLETLEKENISFHAILKEDLTRDQTTTVFNETLKMLYSTYSQRIGVLGIGLDGHTAGIPANNETVTLDDTSVYNIHQPVSTFHDTTGMYKERITLTFAGLEELHVCLVLVFGRDKETALNKMFTSGSEEEIPGRFYLRPDIAAKTIIITDVML